MELSRNGHLLSQNHQKEKGGNPMAKKRKGKKKKKNKVKGKK